MNDLTDVKNFLTSLIEPVVTQALKAGLAATQHQSFAGIPNTKGTEPISPEELCKRLGISKPTAWAWEKKGIIKGYHLGNKKYFIWQEVIAALTRKGEVKS